MQRVFVAIGLAISMSACDGGSAFPASPTTPSPGATTPRSPVTLSPGSIAGLVFELTPAGRQPIADVELYCDACGEFGHTLTHTDANGQYAFTGGVWLAPGVPTLLQVRKDGYGDPPESTSRHPLTPSGPGWREVRVDGDTRFDIELVRR